MSTKLSIVFLFSLFIFSHTYSQSGFSKFDIRMGSGISFLGTADLFPVNIENEINYRISPYFSSSVSFLAGKSYSEEFTNSTFLGANLNVFLSPFKNNKKLDFRIGSGLCYSGFQELTYYEIPNPGFAPYELYGKESLESFGYNIILENSIDISARFLIGIKAFSQVFFNEDINSGILLKIGMKI